MTDLHAPSQNAPTTGTTEIDLRGSDLARHGDLRRIAVLNRGEPAVRFIRAVEEYRAARGIDIQAVAFWTEPDADAPFVHLADDDHGLGPAMRGGVSAYTDHDHVIASVTAAGCDAVWPGWGFASEDPELVAALEANDITFLGPSSQALAALGDKVASRALAEAAEVPLAAWATIEPAMSPDELARVAAPVGFPLMVKASGGGGGRGIRRVDAADGLADAVREVAAEVRASFGASSIFLERCIVDARHIEVQFIGDVDGTASAVGVRDCSVQRRNQKVIEEAPSPVLPASTERQLRAATERLVAAAGYVGVGTAEFLYDPAADQACFIEVNGRLQVEHTLTELVDGIDLVVAQIDLARGRSWREGQRLGSGTVSGHAIEVRLNAEDPDDGFRPSPGRLLRFRPPGGPGIRIDAGVAEGDVIDGAFDSMIAKIIAYAPTRIGAIARMRRALRELVVVVEDGTTNAAFLRTLLDHPRYVDATLHTAWLDGAVARGELSRDTHADLAVDVAAVVDAHASRAAEVDAFFTQVRAGIPHLLPSPDGVTVELRLANRTRTVTAHHLGADRWQVAEQQPDGTVDVRPLSVELRGDHVGTVRTTGADGRQHRHALTVVSGAAGITVELDHVAHRIQRASGGLVRAPGASLVVDVRVAEGQHIEAGQHLLTVEAMKMETRLVADEAGVVRQILCQQHEQVVAGQPLVIVDTADAVASDDQQADVRSGPLPLAALFDGERPDPCRTDAMPYEVAAAAVAEAADLTRAALLGFDLPDVVVARLERLLAAPGFTTLLHPERWAPLAAQLGTFADVEGCFDRNLLAADTEAAAVSAEVAFHAWCAEVADRPPHGALPDPPPGLAGDLAAAVGRYDVTLTPEGTERSDDPERRRGALWRMAVAHAHTGLRHRLCSSISRIVAELAAAEEALALPPVSSLSEQPGLADALDRVERFARGDHPATADNARHAAYALYDRPRYTADAAALDAQIDAALARRAEDAVAMLVTARHRVLGRLLHRAATRPGTVDDRVLVAVALHDLHPDAAAGDQLRRAGDGWTAAVGCAAARGSAAVAVIRGDIAAALADPAVAALAPATVELISDGPAHLPDDADPDVVSDPDVVDDLNVVADLDVVASLDATIRRCTWTWSDGDAGLRHATTTVAPSTAADLSAPTGTDGTTSTGADSETSTDAGTSAGAGSRWATPTEEPVHPALARRLQLDRLADFDLHHVPAPHPVVAVRAVARGNPRDERLLVRAEIRALPARLSADAAPVGSATDPAAGADDAMWEVERAWFEALGVVRRAQADRGRHRLHANRIDLYVRPVVTASATQVADLARHLEVHGRGLGIDAVAVHADVLQPSPEGGTPEPSHIVFRLTKRARHRLEVSAAPDDGGQLRALDDRELAVARARRTGHVHPAEILAMLCGDGGAGDGSATAAQLPHPALVRGWAHPLDLSQDGTRLEEVDELALGCGVVTALVSNVTETHPEGLTRMWIASDPTAEMGALGEPECRRIIAALDLAEQRGLPVEWLPISSGARISMDSGTENLDWTARVVRRLVTFTQAGGQVNLIVTGVNVGAQSYWNAEATMLQHTRGVLIMTPAASMVLTGKRALEHSGGVAAADERGIGGYDRIMGVNGQAQHLATDLGDAYRILFEHYRFSALDVDGRVRDHQTADPLDRDVTTTPYEPVAGEPFARIGDLFTEATNPGRKTPFAIRQVMDAVRDADGGRLERFRGMRDAEGVVVWDTHVGGHGVTMVAIESRPLPRRTDAPVDGPTEWTGGTLYPQGSKKVARAINGASGVRPVVVLANLSGFDGSPESLRNLQLEHGAEIARAVVNFDGPIVFVVIGRYHGGAYVVFSSALNDSMTCLAVEGARASVIGGGPAAAVVFGRQVRARTDADPEVTALRGRVDAAAPDQRPALRDELDRLVSTVRLRIQGEVAAQFDAIHDVDRAVRVGSLDAVVPAARLRPAIIEALAAHREG